MTQDELIGRRIAELRKRSNLRQEDFLERMAERGVVWTRTVLSRIESGTRALKAIEVFALADALGVEVSDLDPDATPDRHGVIRRRLESLSAQWRDGMRELKSAEATVNSLADEYVGLAVYAALSVDPSSEITVRGRPTNLCWTAYEALKKIDDGSVFMMTGFDAADIELHPTVKADVAAFWDVDIPNESTDPEWRRVLNQRFPNLRVMDRKHPGRLIESDEVAIGTPIAEQKAVADLLRAEMGLPPKHDGDNVNGR